MFTSYMTDAELQAAAYQDFQEMRVKVRCAFEKFITSLRVKPGERCVLHSLVENKKYQTRSKNEWNISFRYTGDVGGRLTGCCLMYIPLFRGDNQVDYLFMNNPDIFKPERVSAHFLQRYKERYLEFNHVDLRGVHPAVHFMLNNEDRTQAYYIPHNWTEEDLKEKAFLISKQGLSVAAKHDKMVIYITFMDQENLTRYKALVYEEEEFVKDLSLMKNLKEEEMRNMAKKLFSNPKSREILRRIMYRNIRDKENLDELVDNFMKQWEYALDVTGRYLDEYEKTKENVMKEYAPKSMLDLMQNETMQNLLGKRNES